MCVEPLLGCILTVLLTAVWDRRGWRRRLCGRAVTLYAEAGPPKAKCWAVIKGRAMHSIVLGVGRKGRLAKSLTISVRMFPTAGRGQDRDLTLARERVRLVGQSLPSTPYL
jgi:hypothetical protein